MFSPATSISNKIAQAASLPTGKGRYIADISIGAL